MKLFTYWSVESLFSRLLCNVRMMLFGERVTGNLEPNPGSMGHKAGYTLDWVPIHLRAQSHSHSHTHSYITDTLDMPISLPCMVFGLGEETGVPVGNPHSTGRTCKLHTHRAVYIQYIYSTVQKV
ncbi:hypothetical protein AMELA_G00161180 [Ameiurus melas]|uniref:Uncharacterized protein n=1 Tax=Ameiurus melas TaxID=219545 RepID=A0A7J6AHW1_AMEME|nr:hypothetical protein AMELA_G00161180 [Ameiurus melas]